MSGSLVKEVIEEIIQQKLILYPFKIIFGPNELVLYSLKKEDRAKWIQFLKETIGYSNLSDFYEIGDIIGVGKYGVVRMATHKQSNIKVAIKILKKAKLSMSDIDLIKREIEILKLCQHPNIIRLLDTFENPEYIYIVMDWLRGGDLYSYLEKREFKISESRACRISHSLATAIYYLHSYGIVHRDIKLDNVLMVDETEDSDVKIVDFGLSKIMGPGEFCSEPFGTFGYVAPEVLKNKPYDKEVDIWGLGVVLYILLTGRGPFEDTSEEMMSW